MRRKPQPHHGIVKLLGFVFIFLFANLQLAPLGAEPRTFHFSPEFSMQLSAVRYHGNPYNRMLPRVCCAEMAERLCVLNPILEQLVTVPIFWIDYALPFALLVA